MSITQMTRWKCDERGEILQAARSAKALAEKYGGEFLGFSRFYTGPHVGEWLFAVRYPDWATYAKVQQAQADDAEYHALRSLVGAMAELTDRSVLVDVEL
jgi:hypothetical protein